MAKPFMKILTYIILPTTILLALFLVAACAGEDAAEREPAGAGGPRLQLSARMQAGAAVESRVLGDDAAFPAGDYRFGTWICDHSRLPDFVPAKNGYANLQSDMKVAPSGSQTWTFTFDNGRYGTTLNVSRGVAIDIYSFYPRPQSGTQATSLDNVPFTSGTTDWMWANASLAADDLRGETVNVGLRFAHAMTCMRIRIRCKYTGGINLASITLKDSQNPSRLFTGGSMNLAERKLVTADDRRTDALKVAFETSVNTAYKDFHIFMPPVADYRDGEISLAFVFDGVAAKTEFAIPATIKDNAGNDVTISGFEAGKRYTYSLTLDNQVVFAPVSVDDTWETIDRELIL